MLAKPPTQSSDAPNYRDGVARRHREELRLDAPISFPEICRFLSVAALGAMLAFSASAQTDLRVSQTPSTGTPGSESQTPSTATSGSESQTPTTATPGDPKLQAPPHRAPRPSPSHRVRLLAPIRRSRRLIRHPRPSSHASQRFPIFLSQLTANAAHDRHSRWSRALPMARSTGANSLLNSGRFLHSVSYGANALFAGVGQRAYAKCDLFHSTRTQHSWFGPSWPWHRSVSWVRSSHTFKRSHSLSTRQVGRHGEYEGCHQWT